MMSFIQSVITQSLQPARKQTGQNLSAETASHQPTQTDTVQSQTNTVTTTDDFQPTLQQPHNLKSFNELSTDRASVKQSSPSITAPFQQEIDSPGQHTFKKIAEPSKPATEKEILPALTKQQSEEPLHLTTENASRFISESKNSVIEDVSIIHATNKQTVTQHDGLTKKTIINNPASEISTQDKSKTENNYVEPELLFESTPIHNQAQTPTYETKTDDTSTARKTSPRQQPVSNKETNIKSPLQSAVAMAIEQKPRISITQKTPENTVQQSSPSTPATPQVRIGQINVVVDNPSVSKPARRASQTASAQPVNPFGLRGL